MKELAKLANLTSLSLGGVTDAGLKELSNLRLTSLSVWYSQVTDAVLKELARHRELTRLSFFQSGFHGRARSHRPDRRYSVGFGRARQSRQGAGDRLLQL